MYRLIIAGIGAVAIALLAVGCGGGGGDEATAHLSKAQFYKQANTICVGTQTELKAAFARSKSVDAAFFQRLSTLLKQEAEELEAIEGPEAVEVKVEPLIENVSKASEIIAEEGAAGLNDPRVAAYKSEARRLRLKEC
jgi:hypothetical protein